MKTAAAKKKTVKTVLMTRKELKQEAIAKIESSLAELKASLGEKKFHKRVRKAAKMLTGGLPKAGLKGSAVKEAVS